MTIVSAAAAADAVRARIEQELIEPLGTLGLDIEAIVVTPVGNYRVLRIAVDGDDGVTLDAIADATRVVGEALDGSDAMGERPYTLEVTSRGVDSPLTLPRHWRRNPDRLVKVVTTDGETVSGRILDSTDTSVRLDVDGTHREVAYADVEKAVIQIEFNRRPKEDS